MTDESELQAKIAAVASQINRHKQRQQPRTAHPSRGGIHWMGGRGGHAGIHKNRTLVASTASSGTLVPSQNGLISTRGGHNNQLMTKQTFDRERNQKLEWLAQKRTPQQSPDTQSAHPVSKPRRVLVVDGINFEMQEDGSKLIRIPDPATVERKTPKSYKVAGIDFFRTKKGNLLRETRIDQAKAKPQCEIFTKYGTCPYGPSCKFAHNPEKVAICKDFLHKSCPAGANCDLSHQSTYERVPACTHFIRGNCTKTACLYPHVNVSFDALVCRPFATLGYCAKGDACGNRHVFECPDYANTGHCAKVEKGKCPLPHIDRAGNLRKAAQRQSKTSPPDESDLSSGGDEMEADHDVIDTDSDDSVDIIMGLDDSHELSQQRDYVALS